MKTEVYSWRVSADLKSDLERAARRRKISLSAALDLAARHWLESAAPEDDEAEQKRLHAAAAKYIGAFAGGGNPRRSEQVRQIVQERLMQKHERSRAH